MPPAIAPARTVAAGPLAARWIWYDLPQLRAGVTAHGRAEVENAGSASWNPGPEEQVSISYHWLDSLRNPIVWAGIFSPIQRPVAPGERVELWFAVSAPMPPGGYRLSLDVVAEGRCWFSELGNEPLELDVDVLPRIERRALAVSIREGDEALTARTLDALAAQEEPIADHEGTAAVFHLAPGCLPPPDWSRRVLDAHAEGFAAVGGALEPVGSFRARRQAAALLEPWANRGRGRTPGFDHPLLCPSIVADRVPDWIDDIAGLPTLRPPDEPWLFDGRIQMQVLAETVRT